MTLKHPYNYGDHDVDITKLMRMNQGIIKQRLPT